MPTVIARALILVLLLAQAWFGYTHGRMVCVPIPGCDKIAHPHEHTDCGGHHDHYHHDAHDQDRCEHHHHGPFSPADPDHDHDDCGCHVHLFDPHPEDLTAPVLTASPSDWALIPLCRPALACEMAGAESVAISAPPRPPNESWSAQVRGLASTVLVI